MSIHVISAVLNCRDPELTSSRRMVLVSLANYAGEDGHSWPSQKLISDEAGCGIRSVKDHLKWLEQSGFIVRKTKSLGQGHGSRTSYHILLPRLSRTQPDAGEQIAGANNARANERNCEGGIPPLTNRQEPSITEANASVSSAPEVIVGKSRKPKVATPDPDLQPAFEAYQNLARKLTAERGKAVWPVVHSFTAKRQAALKARIKEHGLDAWGKVLRKAYASSFCTGGTNGWCADFDFLTSPSGFLKTLEGNYDDRTYQAAGGSRSGAGNPGRNGSGPDAFERLAERLSGGSAGPEPRERDDSGAEDGFVIDVTPTRLAG